MTRTLIIGIGNPLRGDDGLGWRVVEALRQMTSLKEVEAVTCHQLTPEMAEHLSRAQYVIFIDACAGSPPGEIRVNRLMAASSSDRSFTHCLDPQGLTQYCRQLYGNSPEGWTISMTGADYGYSESLSVAVESQLPALVDLAAKAATRPPESLGTN